MQAAAQKLAMTPSAVTQTIQKLEQQLQIKLLNRTTRKLSLTEAGETFYQHAAQLEKNAENALKSIETLRQQPVGTLNIACPSGLIDSLLAKAFKSVLNEHPEFRLNLFFEDKLLDLGEQRIDIALRAGSNVLNDAMIARHIFDFEWVTVAHRDYLAQNPAPQNLSELAQMSWIGFMNSRFNQLTFHCDSQSQTIAPNYRIHSNTLYASRRLTMNGLGISVQPLEDVRNYLASGELVSILPEWKLPSVPLYMVTLQRVQSEKVRIACELISHYFAAIR